MFTYKLKKTIDILNSNNLLFNDYKSMPKGTSIETKTYLMKEPLFIYDLTFLKKNKIVREQRIWKKIFSMIHEAEEFIIMDMFLYNDDYNKNISYPKLSEELTKKLIKRKKEKPYLKIIFITDEVNNFYGAYKSHFLSELEKSGIEVIITDMSKLPDSNFIYSFIWKSIFRWFGTAGRGWLNNPFNPNGSKVTLRAYLKLINFKANHRKVVITENGSLISSSNPHDASAFHSNIAFFMDGKIVNSLIKTEITVAKFSNDKFDKQNTNFKVKKESIGNTKVKIITEGKIHKNMIKVINSLQKNDVLNIGVFYLSDRKIIEAILNASERSVKIKLILDANKDAFGIKKNGLPNRPVAVELDSKSKGKIKIRWYDTHGEQFHTKLMHAKMKNESVIIGGSANFTRRNIEDYNLETNVMITAENNREIVKEIDNYFEMLWYNKEGDYTVDFNKYYDNSLLKRTLYRFQEWSGAATY